MESPPITVLLQRAARGDTGASDELFHLLYAELRSQAGRLMEGQRGHTLQPTALVHEAWMRLGVPQGGGWEGRSHFLGAAAKAMRSVLVDHARGKGRQKRGGDHKRIALDAAVAAYEDKDYDVLALDEALGRFAEFDAELARLVELRFFGGLSIPETAEVLSKSTATIERHWRTARAWLKAELDDDA